MTNLKQALLDIARLALPYFTSRETGIFKIGNYSVRLQERWIGLSLFAVIVAINLSQVAISVRLSYFNRDWFNAIEQKNASDFWTLLITVWVFWVAILVVSNMLEFVLTSALKIRWRSWLTDHAISTWLGRKTHYRMQLAAQKANDQSSDNPDQRIAEDIHKFTDTSLSLSVGIINQISTLVSFSVILWGISAQFSIPGTSIQVPGLLFWIALLYASLGTWITHLIGRSLIRLNFQQERFEANFRFSLARLREYAEPVALLNGEGAEQQKLGSRFREVIRNFYNIVRVQKYLTGFIQVYGSSSSVVPYIIVAPYYFAGTVALGLMTQTAGAFGRVEGALAFFIDSYSRIADYKAGIDRLTGFQQAMTEAQALDVKPVTFNTTTDPVLTLQQLAIKLPSGQPILTIADLTLMKGQSVLLTGPSGSGKSTLFRTVAGIWPFATGTIFKPSDASFMLLPQRPYLPIGTLREAVTYPGLQGLYSDEIIAAALEQAQLPYLSHRLDEEGFWTQMLSTGEQQRLSLARALLLKPDWLLLDESTSALDEPTEQLLYERLVSLMPNTTLLSIGHRSTLIGLHQRHLTMTPSDNGAFVL